MDVVCNVTHLFLKQRVFFSLSCYLRRYQGFQFQIFRGVGNLTDRWVDTLGIDENWSLVTNFKMKTTVIKASIVCTKHWKNDEDFIWETWLVMYLSELLWQTRTFYTLIGNVILFSLLHSYKFGWNSQSEQPIHFFVMVVKGCNTCSVMILI